LIDVARIIRQDKHRIDWNHFRHSYLIDIGCRIEIPMMVVSPGSGNQLLNPPFKETRFFIIEIDEVLKDGRKRYAFQDIVPVQAHRTPDWQILKFRIKRGRWIVTERIPKRTTDGETQWLYTNDFNIIFLSSGGRHDHESLKSLILTRLDAIAQSIRCGIRIPSEFEKQLAYRDAFKTMFSVEADGVVCDAVVYQPHSLAHSNKTHWNDPVPASAHTCRNPNNTAVSLQEIGDLNFNQIEELRDLSWLTE
jgi:hypothetical protein